MTCSFVVGQTVTITSVTVVVCQGMLYVSFAFSCALFSFLCFCTVIVGHCHNVKVHSKHSHGKTVSDNECATVCHT